MKKIVLLAMAICMAAATGVSAKGGPTVDLPIEKQDTIVVKMANGAKMILHLQDMKQLKAFKTYSLDSLMRELDKYIAEVDKLEGAAQQDDASKQMTVVFNKTGDGKATEQVTVTIEETDAQGNVTRQQREIKVERRKEIVSDEVVAIVREAVKTTHDDDDEDLDDEEEDTTTHVKPYKSTRFNLDLDLGLNTFIDREDNNDIFVPDLKPMGSRYVSINSHLISQIGGQKSPFFLVSGLEFAFNNYMFDKNVIVQDIDDETVFTKIEEVKYDKSKLATSSVNVPLMAMLDFKRPNGKEGFHVGAGGFVGYRLGSHSKIKYEHDGSTTKDKDHGSFNLTDMQYGLTGVIGYDDLSLFVKYNMNDLFKENRGPQLNTISFGLRILN